MFDRFGEFLSGLFDHSFTSSDSLPGNPIDLVSTSDSSITSSSFDSASAFNGFGCGASDFHCASEASSLSVCQTLDASGSAWGSIDSGSSWSCDVGRNPFD
jgi:hypothetical protein